MTGKEGIMGLSVVLKSGSQVDLNTEAVYNFLTFEVSWLQRSEPGCRSKKESTQTQAMKGGKLSLSLLMSGSKAGLH